MKQPALPFIALLLFSPLITNAGDFEDRCAHPDVIRCYSFDDMSDITTGNPQNTVPYEPASRIYDPTGGTGDCTLQGGTRCWDLDPSTKVSGASSLRFQVPSETGADSSGSFHLNFADDYSQRFGEGEEFYVQYRYRLSPEMIYVFQGSDGFKSAIIGGGDWPGGPAQHSCTDLETVVQTENGYLGPFMYHSCGHFNRLANYWDPTTCNQIRNQHVGAPYCCYNSFPGGCWVWQSNDWMTIQVHIRIGTWNVAGTSRVRMWGSHEGEESTLVYDSDISGQSSSFAGRIINNDSQNNKFGKVWLTPYNTNKSSSESHPVGYVWYDDLIISRSKIADPGSSVSNDPPQAPTNLEVD
jgi:hypothetical protein